MEDSLENRVIGIKIHGDESATPALGASVTCNGAVQGRIVNTGYSPTLGQPIALALLAADVAYVGLEFEVESPQGLSKAETVSAPFIFNRSMTIRPQEDSYLSR